MASRLKVLLLQAREADDPMRSEERRSFAARAGLELEQLRPFDLLSGPPTLAEIQRHDALMVGGSGDYYVSNRDLPDFDTLLGVLGDVVDAGHPTFASCFGFQLAVCALGGRIVHDPDKMEVGTYELSLTDAGREDALLGTLPGTFRAQIGRKDRAEILPDSVLHLASSELCPFHALRVPGKPIWATQFHPELTCADNRDRFLRYVDGYADHMSRDELDATLGGFHESPETESLIPHFLRLVFE